MTDRADQEAKAAPNGAANHLGVARSYADIARIIADYCEYIGMSRTTLDAEAFIGSGHAAKALARRARKRLGWTTLGRVMDALGLVLIVARDPAAHILGSTIASRNGSSRDRHWRNVKGPAWGRRMSAMRNLKLPGSRRTEIARHAAQVRHRGAGAAPAGIANGSTATQPGPQAAIATSASPLDTATNKPAPVPSLRRQRPRQLHVGRCRTGHVGRMLEGSRGMSQGRGRARTCSQLNRASNMPCDMPCDNIATS